MPNSKTETDAISQIAILKKRGYKMLSKLGEGSYAKVYRAEFVPLQSDDNPGAPIPLAVKIIENRTGPHEFNKKFLPRELNILSRISHPHIVHIHSILQIGQKYYIFMRFAEQGDLLDFILKFGTANENQARVWTRQIALALQYLHELNIAHRDMKCENILVTNNFNAKLCDFGFARYSVDFKKRPVLSETYCGSLSYASPEILQGRPYNPKISDIWSFGVVIYVMLNKSMPYDDNNPKLLFENQMKRNFKFRSKVVDVLSNEVKLLVTNLLEPDPMKRYRVEGILKSEWIAMDKRLTLLSPLEQAALTTAFENPLAPPENLTLPKFSTVTKKTSELNVEELKNSSANSIGIIKPYKRDQIRLSENSKMPKNPIQKDKANSTSGSKT